MVTRIFNWTEPGSLLFITAFGTDDPSCSRLAETVGASGKNSFAPPGGERRTFLEPGEVRDLFPNWRALHHWEGMGPDHRHGPDGPVHHHALIEAVLQRTT